MVAIAKGSAGTWRTWQLIELWATADDDFGESDADRAYELFVQIDGEIVRNLIVLVAGSVHAVAVMTGRSFDDALSDAWMQPAMSKEDDDVSRAMRAAVTAWSGGDETAQAFIDSGQLDEVDPEDFVLYLLGVLLWIGRGLVAMTSERLDTFLTGLRMSLGTEGSPPDA